MKQRYGGTPMINLRHLTLQFSGVDPILNNVCVSSV